VISVLLLGLLALGLATALVLIPPAERPTLEPQPSPSATR
jgi:hypothetical protein